MPEIRRDQTRTRRRCSVCKEPIRSDDYWVRVDQDVMHEACEKHRRPQAQPEPDAPRSLQDHVEKYLPAVGIAIWMGIVTVVDPLLEGLGDTASTVAWLTLLVLLGALIVMPKRMLARHKDAEVQDD